MGSKLNGWVRIWVVLTAIWSVTTITVSVKKYPSDRALINLQNSTIEYISDATDEKHEVTREDKLNRSIEKIRLNKRFKSEYSNSEQVFQFHSSISDSRPNLSKELSKVRERYKFEIIQVQEYRKNHIIQYASGLLIYPLALYLFGYLISWIRTGFNNK
jgi:hypothetical protein